MSKELSTKQKAAIRKSVQYGANLRISNIMISCGIRQFFNVDTLISNAWRAGFPSSRGAPTKEFMEYLAKYLLGYLIVEGGCAAYIFSDAENGPAYKLGMLMSVMKPDHVKVECLGRNPNSENIIYLFTVLTDDSREEPQTDEYSDDEVAGWF